MRFLTYLQSSRIGTKSTFSLIEREPRDLPQYAILSHRWGSDEVTYQDIKSGTTRGKNGNEKLKFCARQAIHDGFMYFWVDTCCIDKSSSAEVSEAINCMYKWYQNAAKCYVYLNDVSAGQEQWKTAFSKSEWFRRGWTLQELIAPRDVEFYSVECKKLGSKDSLEKEIHDITGISIDTLRGKQLSLIDVKERFSWTAQRQTTVEEDAVYCLLGIFDVHMSLIYGEGQQKALARLQRKILRTSQFKGSVTAQDEAVGMRSHMVDPAFVIENNLPWNSDGAEGPCRHPQSIPNVIVGIDFGLTHTAVCWSEGPEWCEPQIIRQWPRSGASRRTLTDKVKTAVGYDDNGVLVNWGLESGNDDKMIVTEEYFKIYLDPAFHDNHSSRPTFRESLRFYEDFMRSLYLHIDLYLREQMTDYDERSIEFLLSIPTSWERLPFVSTLQQYLDSLDLKKHWSRIYLTEAEAVAVNLAEVYIAGDTLMVVDAGGATTDINALRVLDFAETVIGLRSLSQAEAINAGSMLVDECMRGILRSRLQDLGVSCDSSNLARIADDTLRAKPFEPIKCTFSGSPTQIDCDIVFTIPADAGYGIGNRRVIVTGRELKEVFDSQIQLIAGKIDEQLFKLQQEYSSSVDYIILAGGLGSSTYVLRMLKARFPKHKILCVDKPRLAVANGLVRNRILELREEAIRQLWSKESSEDGSSDKTPLGISVESSTVSTEGLVRTVISRISTPN